LEIKDLVFNFVSNSIKMEGNNNNWINVWEKPDTTKSIAFFDGKKFTFDLGSDEDFEEFEKEYRKKQEDLKNKEN
jgi:chloramphenicol O-acetyltransferase